MEEHVPFWINVRSAPCDRRPFYRELFRYFNFRGLEYGLLVSKIMICMVNELFQPKPQFMATRNFGAFTREIRTST